MRINQRQTYLTTQFLYVLILQAIFTSCTVFFEYKGMLLDESLLLMARLGGIFHLFIAAVGLLKNRGARSQQGSLILGLGLIGLGIAIFSFATSILYVSIGGVIIGLGSALAKPVITVLYGECVSKKESVRLFKKIYAVTNLGALVGPFFFGLLHAADYFYGFLILSGIAFFSALKHLNIDHTFFFLRRHWGYLISTSVALFLYLQGNILIGISLLLLAGIVKFSNTGVLYSIRKTEKLPILRVFILFLLIDQKYFLLQEIFVTDLNTPFNIPLLYAFSALVIVLGISVQLKIKKTLSTTHSMLLALFLCAFAYSFLTISLMLNAYLLTSLFICLVLFSLSEIIYIPRALERLSKDSFDKVIGVSLFFVTLGLARLAASFLNQQLESSALCLILTIFSIVAAGQEICLKVKMREATL